MNRHVSLSWHRTSTGANATGPRTFSARKRSHQEARATGGVGKDRVAHGDTCLAEDADNRVANGGQLQGAADANHRREGLENRFDDGGGGGSAFEEQTESGDDAGKRRLHHDLRSNTSALQWISLLRKSERAASEIGKRSFRNRKEQLRKSEIAASEIGKSSTFQKYFIQALQDFQQRDFATVQDCF